MNSLNRIRRKNDISYIFLYLHSIPQGMGDLSTYSRPTAELEPSPCYMKGNQNLFPEIYKNCLLLYKKHTLGDNLNIKNSAYL